jgi:hypothetical protein
MKMLILKFLLAFFVALFSACWGGDSTTLADGGATGSGITKPKDAKSAPRILLGVAPGLPAPANSFRFNYPQDAVESDDGSIYVTEPQSRGYKMLEKILTIGES